MGLFDRIRAGRRSSRTLPPPLAPKPSSRPSYELTVDIGGEVSRLSIPIDFDEVFTPEANRGPNQTASQCWVPPGKTIEVGGQSISGGLVYVGENLRAADRDYIGEPALIDPKLEVGSGQAGDSGYWSSYQSLSPAERGAYLRWLAGPRRRPEADQTQLFVYFYGLERRLLVDPKADDNARAERGTLVRELERLEGEGEGDQGHGSFAHYLEALLDFLAAEDLLAGTRKVEPPTVKSGWEVPLTLRIMIGELAAARLRLPAELAKSWISTSPEAYLRTPAERCPEEFARLFSIRYRERFGDGLALPEGAPLRLSYRAASQGLDEAGRRTSVPDICSSAQLIEPLRALGRDCSDELAAYSRWLGRHPEGAGFKGTALLPAPLLADTDDPTVVSLREVLARAEAGQEPWVIAANDLIDLWEPEANKLGKKEAVLLCQLLEKLGYGIEPDPRFGSPNLKREMPAALFPLLAGDPSAPSPAYAAACRLLHLMAAVARADGTVSAEEEALLETHILAVDELYPGEQARLRAHGNWLTRSQLRLPSLGEYGAALSNAERQAIARSVVALAAADGQIDPEEVKTLQKIFKLLELDAESVYSELHAASAGDGPVVVRNGPAAESGEPLPQSGSTEVRRGLDRAAIDAKIEETAAVSTLLSGIFTEAEESEVPEKSEAEQLTDELSAKEVGTPRLSATERAFALALAERESWSREEIEELAARHEVMVDGALESVNEAAFELCGSPFSEGDQPIEIDSEVAKEMLA
jgi:uncharacterized tellurite resistance protein B-like protein